MPTIITTKQSTVRADLPTLGIFFEYTWSAPRHTRAPRPPPAHRVRALSGVLGMAICCGREAHMLYRTFHTRNVVHCMIALMELLYCKGVPIR